MLNRRIFIGGFFAAPAIVQAENIMPIFSRSNWTLAYSGYTDHYDVVFPSGYIKPAHEVWPKLYSWDLPTINHRIDWNKDIEYYPITNLPDHMVRNPRSERINANLARFPRLGFEERHAAYRAYRELIPADQFKY